MPCGETILSGQSTTPRRRHHAPAPGNRRYQGGFSIEARGCLANTQPCYKSHALLNIGSLPTMATLPSCFSFPAFPSSPASTPARPDQADRMPDKDSSSASGPPPETSFTFIWKLPTETQLEILKNCQPTDLVCVSLTCHYLRILALPMIVEKPALGSYEQAKDPFLCDCGDPVEVKFHQDFHDSRQHIFSHQITSRCSKRRGSDWYPPGHGVCERPGCKHCECITCPLNARLKVWMGKEWKYCDKCRKFTNKRKYHNGRCK